MVNALHQKLLTAGVDIRLSTAVESLTYSKQNKRVVGAQLSTGVDVRPRTVIAAIAAPILSRLTDPVSDPAIDAIDYTGVVSTVVATRDDVPLDRYWTNFVRPFESFGGIFRLDLLNESLGHPGVRLLNFCTHVRNRHKGSMLNWDESKIEQRYLDDFEHRFGVHIRPEWIHTSRIPFYSPVFTHGYTNPPVTHGVLSNVFLAGNHRTCPILATTGSAMASGAEAAKVALASRHLKVSAVGDTEAA
jgi:hypothetical protein